MIRKMFADLLAVLSMNGANLFRKSDLLMLVMGRQILDGPLAHDFDREWCNIMGSREALTDEELRQGIREWLTRHPDPAQN